MGATKLAALSMGMIISTALVIMTASPGTLAAIDMALVGLLYVIRRRRQHRAASGAQKIRPVPSRPSHRAPARTVKLAIS